jgi:hypothetical protein
MRQKNNMAAVQRVVERLLAHGQISLDVVKACIAQADGEPASASAS